MFEDPIPPSRLNGEISGRMDKLILKAIDKDPARRFASALEMRDELLAISGGAGGGKAGASTGAAKGAGPERAKADSGARAAKDAGDAPKKKNGKEERPGPDPRSRGRRHRRRGGLRIKMMSGGDAGGTRT